MTRFVRLRATDLRGLPGERLRLESDPDTGPTLHHERVTTGCEYKVGAIIRENFATIVIDEGIAEWLQISLGQLRAAMAPTPTIDGRPLAEAVDMDSDATQPMGVDGEFDKGGCK